MGEIEKQLASTATELTRSRGFIRGSLTQLSKAEQELETLKNTIANRLQRQTLWDATHHDQFTESGVPNLPIKYHVLLNDRSLKLLSFIRAGGALDAVVLDRDAQHNSTRNTDPASVQQAVDNTIEQITWAKENGGEPRYYNAIPMSGNYNKIRTQLAEFISEVINPILPMLNELSVVDTPFYFDVRWFAEWNKFREPRNVVAQKMAAVSALIEKPIAVWLWATRYSEADHLTEHIEHLRSVGLEVVLWGSVTIPASHVNAVRV